MATNELKFVPCDSWDLGTQRCRMHEHQLKVLDLKNGSYVLVFKKDQVNVCKVFASSKKCGSKNIVLYDSTVSVVSPNSSNSYHHVQRLNIKIINEIIVTLVLNSVDDIVNCKKKPYHIKNYVKEILLQYGLVADCVVDCKNHPLGELLKLDKIQIVFPVSHAKDAVLVCSKEVNVVINSVISKSEYDQSCHIQQTTDLIGMEKPYQMLQNYINIFSSPNASKNLGLNKSFAVLIDGPNGSGKTSLVRKIARDNNFALIGVSCSELASPRPGSSERTLEDLFERANNLVQYRPCILFLDDIDSVGCETAASATTGFNALLGQLLSLLGKYQDVDRLCVVGATSRPLALDPALRQPGKFSNQVSIGLPDLRSRQEIFRRHLMSISSDINFFQLAELTHGCTAADLIAVSRLTIYQALHTKKLEEINMQDFFQVLQNFKPSIQRGNNFICHNLKPINWTEIGGLQPIKDSLQLVLDLAFKNPELLIQLNVPPIKGILLYGPPGCCKTTLVRAVASHAKAAFFAVGASDIYSPFVGDSEKAIAEVFRTARSWSPSVIFFDEIDAVVGTREKKSRNDVQEKVLSTILNEMDGIGFQKQESNSNAKDHKTKWNSEILVIAATNRPDLIDTALLRPGRFDRMIYIPLPNFDARLEILKIITASMPVDHADLTYVAQITDGYSGADLKSLCREAALLAMREEGILVGNIRRTNFETALQHTLPSVTKDQIEFFRKFNEQ